MAETNPRSPLGDNTDVPREVKRGNASVAGQTLTELLIDWLHSNSKEINSLKFGHITMEVDVKNKELVLLRFTHSLMRGDVKGEGVISLGGEKT